MPNIFVVHAGNGSAGHLAMKYLKLVTGIELQHVPYKVPARTSSTWSRPHAGDLRMPHVKAGKLRVIAVGTAKRLPTLPEVATVAEQGYPGFEASQWYGLNVPAPPAIVKRLADEVQDRRRRAGRLDPQDAEFIAREQGRWREVIQRANIKVEWHG